MNKLSQIHETLNIWYALCMQRFFKSQLIFKMVQKKDILELRSNGYTKEQILTFGTHLHLILYLMLHGQHIKSKLIQPSVLNTTYPGQGCGEGAGAYPS